MDYVFSKHSLEQMELRNISRDMIENILNNPDEIKNYNGKRIYQSIVKLQEKNYLIRIFVNVEMAPQKIITVYKTSNIKKYYESKI